MLYVNVCLSSLKLLLYVFKARGVGDVASLERSRRCRGRRPRVGRRPGGGQFVGRRKGATEKRREDGSPRPIGFLGVGRSHAVEASIDVVFILFEGCDNLFSRRELAMH